MLNEENVEIMKEYGIQQDIFREVQVMSLKNKVIISSFVLVGFFSSNTFAMDKNDGSSHTSDKAFTRSPMVSYETLNAVGENFVSMLEVGP